MVTQGISLVEIGLMKATHWAICHRVVFFVVCLNKREPPCVRVSLVGLPDTRPWEALAVGPSLVGA